MYYADCALFFLAHCPPGTHGRKKKLKPSKHLQNVTIEHITLMPYCRTCPVGTYQSNYGQLSCRPCQKGFTTNNRKSANSSQCVSTARHICESNPGICNGGSCVAQHDFLYSCLCDGQHIGKLYLWKPTRLWLLLGYFWKGSHCEIRINSCSSNPCLNGGICSPTYDNQDESYSCQCKDGFGGKHCQDVLEICSIKCVNNGTCVTNEDNDQVCVCEEGKFHFASFITSLSLLRLKCSGYGGQFCEEKLHYCSEGLCENGGRCLEQGSGYKCRCQNGYIGRRCTLLPCDYKQACSPHFVCVNLNVTNATRKSYR